MISCCAREQVPQHTSGEGKKGALLRRTLVADLVAQRVDQQQHVARLSARVAQVADRELQVKEPGLHNTQEASACGANVSQSATVSSALRNCVNSVSVRQRRGSASSK